MSRYHDVYAAWQRDPLAFWAAAASAIDWFEPWEAVLASRDGLDRWFVGAVCNTAWNCLDRHVAAGHGERRALIYDRRSPAPSAVYNYRALLDEVEIFAAVLADLGVAKGDRVLIYMPMVPEAVDRHAGLRPARRRSFGGVRRFCRRRAGDPHRRCAGPRSSSPPPAASRPGG